MPKLFEAANNLVVECRNLTKEFYFVHPKEKKKSVRGNFVQILKGDFHQTEPIFSLREFDLRVYKGESVALVGPNGSGKSTALRLIAGVYEPTAGLVKTVGRVGAVIELGAGFHRELTGAENVELYGAILGLKRRELKNRYEEIIDFSEIREFIQMPVKYYSSGMIARLAFSVAICTEPDILLLDEVLAVGDHTFRTKCLTRLNAFRASGRTLVLTSHDREQLVHLCTQAVWLDHGCIQMRGRPEEVLKAYYGNQK